MKKVLGSTTSVHQVIAEVVTKDSVYRRDFEAELKKLKAGPIDRVLQKNEDLYTLNKIMGYTAVENAEDVYNTFVDATFARVAV